MIAVMAVFFGTVAAAMYEPELVPYMDSRI